MHRASNTTQTFVFSAARIAVVDGIAFPGVHLWSTGTFNQTPLAVRLQTLWCSRPASRCQKARRYSRYGRGIRLHSGYRSRLYVHPIATSLGRAGFGPQLEFSYDPGAGNRLFGVAWHLAFPSITRKTDEGLPSYDDAESADVFILSGAKDLVPVLDKLKTPVR